MMKARNPHQQDGSLGAACDYSDFGETTEITGNGLDNQICYTGGIYDEKTSLYYLNARYYDPANGRFISQDTYRGELNEPGQWHLYAYCANNPINYVDPSGHTASKRYGNAWKRTESLGWGMTIQVAKGKFIRNASIGISMVWLNKNVENRKSQTRHTYFHISAGLSKNFANQVKSTIRKNSGKVYSLAGLKTLKKALGKLNKKGVTISAQYFRVYGRKGAKQSYNDLAGPTFVIGATYRHFDVSIGIGKKCSAVGGGISTGKAGAGASIANYIHSSEVRNFYKGVFSQSKVIGKAQSYL